MFAYMPESCLTPYGIKLGTKTAQRITKLIPAFMENLHAQFRRENHPFALMNN